MSLNTFAHNITYLRTQKRLTQEQAADAIGVKVKRYQAWEEGRSFPRQRVIVKVCEVLEYYDIYKLLNARLQ